MNTAHQTRDFFSSYAHDFDAIYGSHHRGLIQRQLDQIFRKSMWLRYQKTLEGCDPVVGRSVLDIGCGPGHYSIALSKRGAARVVGLDFSIEMIRLSSEYAVNEGLEGRCQFLVQDFLTFSSDEEFDFSIACGVMDYIERPKEFVSKVMSHTRSKCFFSFPKKDGLMARYREYRYRRRCPLYLYRESDLQNIFEERGAWKLKIESIARDYFVTLQR